MRRHVFLSILLSYVLIFTFVLHHLISKDSLSQNEEISQKRLYFSKSDVRKMLQDNPDIVQGILEDMNRVDGFKQNESNNEDEETEYEERQTAHRQEGLDSKQRLIRNMNVGMSTELNRQHNVEGLGEMGQPAVLGELSENEERTAGKMWYQHRFNAYLSQKISIHRKLPDLRDDECKEPARYSHDLPTTSIIICFYNEEWSVLLRLVHSILSRSREKLIEEIILIDDFSTLKHLKGQLDDYMSKLRKVKVIHTNKRLGIANARILGAKAAKAPVLTFLDSHCEVTEGWLEPLLDTVKKNRTTVVIPIVEVINEYNFGIRKTLCEHKHVGGFGWDLMYSWHVPPEEDTKNKRPCDNVRSPTMSGGLFSIDSNYFKEIGYYDENMEVWGGENLGVSFKIWMCGGRIEIAPCSHIGHIYRTSSPYIVESAKEFGAYIEKNQNRVAEAWMDEWKEYFYKQRKPKYDVDVSKELDIRKRLKCKSFDWYLQNIFPTQVQPKKALASGELRPIANQNLCLDVVKHEDRFTDVVVDYCKGRSGYQYWYLTPNGEIRIEQECLDHPMPGYFIMYGCNGEAWSQYWTYNPKTHHIYHPATNECLAVNLQNFTLKTQKCGLNINGEWHFEEEKREELARLFETP